MDSIGLRHWVKARSEWTPETAFDVLFVAVKRDVEEANALPDEVFGGDRFLVSRAAPSAHQFSVVRSNGYDEVVDRVDFRREGNVITLNEKSQLRLTWDYESGTGKFVFTTGPKLVELGALVYAALEPLFFPKHPD